jgi:hypothetical protein
MPLFLLLSAGRMAGMEAGVNRFPRFLRSKNLKPKIATEGDFRQRKG